MCLVIWKRMQLLWHKRRWVGTRTLKTARSRHHNTEQRDLTTRRTYAGTHCHRRPYSPATIHDSSRCSGSSFNITGDLVKGCACALVVVNMRALDSYRERLRMFARLRNQREGIGKMQSEAEQLLCGFGRPQRLKGSSPTRSAGHEASLAGKKRRRLRVRCSSTIITEKTHNSCTSSTASSEQSHYFFYSFLFGGVFRHQAEGRGLPGGVLRSVRL